MIFTLIPSEQFQSLNTLFTPNSLGISPWFRPVRRKYLQHENEIHGKFKLASISLKLHVTWH